MKWFCLFLELLLFCSFAIAEDCAITSKNSDEFFFELHIQADGTALMKIQSKIPYSKECVQKNNLQALMQKPAECKGDIISDALFRSMDFFIIRSECKLSYNEQTSHLIVETSSTTEKIAAEKDGVWEVKFDKWAMAPSTSENALKIFLPAGSEIISYFPKKNSIREKNFIYWQEIPSEPIGLKYSAPQPLEKNPLAIAVGALGVIVVAVLVLRKFFASKNLEKKIKELEAKKEALNKELKDSETAYLKRKIDEKTYGDLVEEIKIKISDVKVEERTLSASKLEKKTSQEKQEKTQKDATV